MQQEVNKDTSCPYLKVYKPVVAMEPTRCFTELTEAEQLTELESLIVSGKLWGKLPFGFLEDFRDLPNELVLKIW